MAELCRKRSFEAWVEGIGLQISLYLVSCYSQRRTLQGEKQIFAEESNNAVFWFRRSAHHASKEELNHHGYRRPHTAEQI